MPEITPQPFNLTGLKAAWDAPRPDTWTHGGADDRWRWRRDLARAVAQNNTALVDRLVEDGASLEGPMTSARQPTTTIKPGTSWLAQAACRNNVAMMEHLVQRGADLHAPAAFRDDKPLLHHALHHDALDAAQWLIDHGVGWDGVGSDALFNTADPGGASWASERCMVAWLTVWDRPWADPDDALAWARFALAEDDSSLLRFVLQRTPQGFWNTEQLETLWITAIQFDRDEGVRELLDAGVVPDSDLAQHRSFDLGNTSKQSEMRGRRPIDPEFPMAWWMRDDQVATPWSWLVIRAGARRIGERWLTVPAELARMAETVAQEPLVWLQRPASNLARQGLPALEALAQRIDLSGVRDEEGNTPLHRWLGLAMETEEILTWTATNFPDWADTLNHHGQTAWALADELQRPRGGAMTPFPRRMHEARCAWDAAILRGMDTPGTGNRADAPRDRPRL